jgi:hypothetical protein
MSFFSSGPNMSKLEQFYIDKSQKMNEVLNGLYMNCIKENDKTIVKLHGPLYFGDQLMTLDKLKNILKEKFDKTNFICIDKQDKYNKNYYGKYFIHLNIDKNKNQKISFIDKPLSNIIKEKGVTKYTFEKKVILVKDTNDILYAIVDKKLELEKRYLSLSNFYVDKENKLNGSYFSFLLESDIHLKKYMTGTSITGDIISFNNESVNEYFENMKKSYKDQTIEYQRDFRMCESSFNIGMFSNSGWENKLKNEPKKNPTIVCSIQSRRGTRKNKYNPIETMKEELEETKKKLELIQKSIEDSSKVKFIKVKKIDDDIIQNKLKYNNYTKGILKIKKIYEKDTIKNYVYFKNLKSNNDRLKQYYSYYEILDPNNNSENKVNNAKKNGNKGPNKTVDKVNNGTVSTVNNGTVSKINNGTVGKVNNGTVSTVNNGTVITVNNGTVSTVNNGTVSTVNNGTVSKINNGIVSTVNNGTVSKINNGIVSKINNGTVSTVNNGTESTVNNRTVSKVNNGSGNIAESTVNNRIVSTVNNRTGSVSESTVNNRTVSKVNNGKGSTINNRTGSVSESTVNNRKNNKEETIYEGREYF